MILGPSACICFDKEGYHFFDMSPRQMWATASNMSFWRFFLGNVSLSLSELRKDVDKARFLAEVHRQLLASGGT